MVGRIILILLLAAVAQAQEATFKSPIPLAQVARGQAKVMVFSPLITRTELSAKGCGW